MITAISRSMFPDINANRATRRDSLRARPEITYPKGYCVGCDHPRRVVKNNVGVWRHPCTRHTQRNRLAIDSARECDGCREALILSEQTDRRIHHLREM